MHRKIMNKLDPSGSADPFVVYVWGYYYYLKTAADRIVLRRGRTLAGLCDESKTVYKAGGEVACHIWAPELHAFDGRWYIYACGSTVMNSFRHIRMFCLESLTADPFGEYTFKAFTDPDEHAIDQTVFRCDRDGKLYTAYSLFTPERGQVIMFAEMENPWTVSERRLEISVPELDWEVMGANPPERPDPRVNEGPAVLQRGGKVMVIYSASGCWSRYYCLGMVSNGGDLFDRASWPKNPEPLFREGNSVYGVGHCSFFKSPDGREDWIAYHGMDAPGAGEAGRYMHVQRFNWDGDRPVFGETVGSGKPMDAPGGEA